VRTSTIITLKRKCSQQVSTGPKKILVLNPTQLNMICISVCGEEEALEMVLRAGARVSTPDVHGGYPLHYAAQMCGPGSDPSASARAGLAVLHTLLAAGADVDAADKDGRQPILWAASAGKSRSRSHIDLTLLGIVY